MADVWHYRMDGTVLGPVHFADLQGLAAIGRLQPTHEVRRHQDAHWQRVQDVAGLLPGGAAPLSDNTADDASEHDLDAMLSGPSAGMLEPVDVSDHDLEGLLAGAESTDTDDDLTSDLDAMLATNAGGDVGIGRASRQAGANRWYYRHLGQMLGPVDLDGLMDLCAAGKLTPADEIRLTHSSDWERADSIVGLFAYQPSPAHQPSTAIDDADEPAEWYYRREGENLGPVTFSALLQLVAEGVLAPADEIRQGKLGGWMEAVSMVGLFSRDQLIAAGYIAAPEEMAEAEPLATVLPELPPPPPRPPREKNDAPKGKRKGKDKGRRPEKSQHDAAMEDWAASVLSEPSQEEERPRRSTTPAAARATTTSKPTTETEETSAVAAETSAFDVAPTPATAAPSPFAAAARTTSPPPPPPPSKAAKAPKKSRSGPSISIPAGMGPILVKVGGAVGALAVLAGLWMLVFGGLKGHEEFAETKAMWNKIKPLYEKKAPDAEWASVAALGADATAMVEKAKAAGAGADQPLLLIVLRINRDLFPEILKGKSKTPAHRVTAIDNYLKQGDALGGP